MLEAMQYPSVGGTLGSEKSAGLMFIGKMQLDMDADVKAVLEFMSSNISAHKLVSVAQEASQLAPILWGHYEAEQAQGLRLHYPKFTGCASPQLDAIGSAAAGCVGGDSAVATGADALT